MIGPLHLPVHIASTPSLHIIMCRSGTCTTLLLLHVYKGGSIRLYIKAGCMSTVLVGAGYSEWKVNE